MLASAQVSALGEDAELDRYTQEAADINCDSCLSFWQERESSCPLRDMVSAPINQSIIHFRVAPSSQAYVEHVVTCARKRNRASGILECRVFLKMNTKLLHK